MSQHRFLKIFQNFLIEYILGSTAAGTMFQMNYECRILIGWI